MTKTIIMATDRHKKGKDPNSIAHDQAENAHDQAEKDMEKDPELSDPDRTDDLDEGELARRDNSDEEALDYLERPRHEGKGHEDQEDKGKSGGDGGRGGGGHGGHTDKGHGGH
jgi:hypothetical protein